MTVETFSCGLIGRGITASRSPAIHEAEALALGLALSYRIVDFDALGYGDDLLADVVRLLAAIGWRGCNVTHPFKQAALPLCDRVSEDAALLGAVNTLTFRDGEIHGDNTDWIGFSWMIEEQIGSVRDASIAQIGVGGAGSATAYALARMGAAEIALFDPSQERRRALAERLAPHFPACRFVDCQSAQDAIAGRAGVVQSTPIGMATHPGVPFDPGLLRADQWLADIIYFPAETSLLAQSRARGVKAINGIGMVVGQAAEAFRLFTGLTPDRRRMLETVRAGL